ncbi:MAG: hypothetical protein KAW39_07965 [Thermoplasmata archaeon]|nr:hypothetical protein [Thermoplasmata archaeon]
MTLEIIAAPVFLLLFLILGFLVVFLFRKVFLVEMVEFEYYLLSAVCSAFIYFIALEIYVTIFQPIGSLDVLVLKLLDQSFIALVAFSWMVVFLFCFLLYRLKAGTVLRKYLGRERKLRIVPEKEIWDDILREHTGFLVVLTEDNQMFYGAHRRHSFEGERMLHLYYPYLIEDLEARHIEDMLGLEVQSILFFEDDIKRIYFIPKEQGVLRR